MKLHKRFIYRLFIVCVSLSCMLCGCAQKQEKPLSFDEFTDELFREEISSNTLNLHYTLAYPENYGIKDYDITLGDFTIEDLENYDEELLALKAELEAYDYKSLTTNQQLTYDIIEDH
ncbi:MAG: DUF885 domain-containing protein, partial [Lachnospiraceae bacterium]|nr:DUF885 domain-containing protein [Lachnospiraceae bacterium]